MSNSKNALLGFAEMLGVSPAQLLAGPLTKEEILTDWRKDLAEKTDEEWQEHITLHNTSPSVNCCYCAQNADGEEMELEEYD